MPRVLSGPGFIIYGHDDSNGSNILLSSDSTPKPFCPNDGSRLVYMDKFVRCEVCGYSLPADDFKPASGLVAKTDGSVMLTQPQANDHYLDDLPPGAQIVKEDDLSA